MALEIEQLLDYSWMSQASYLSLDGMGENGTSSAFEEKLTNEDSINSNNKFTSKQAEIFTGSNTSDTNDGFSFIHHQENTTGVGPRSKKGTDLFN